MDADSRVDCGAAVLLQRSCGGPLETVLRIQAIRWTLGDSSYLGLKPSEAMRPYRSFSLACWSGRLQFDGWVEHIHSFL